MTLYEGEGPVPGPRYTGRRGLLTAEMQDEIVRHLASGAFYDEVAQAVGIGASTIHGWRERGRRAAEKASTGADLDPAEVTYMDFWVAVEKARGEARVYAHATIRAAMRTHWQAAAWYLERTNPARYARWSKTGDELPTTEELEDAPAPEGVDEVADEREAVLLYARRWVEERRAAQAS